MTHRSLFLASILCSSIALAVEDPLKNIKAPEGFDVSLFANQPDVGYPTSVSASPDGSAVFVAVDENGSLDAKPDRGRVLRCLDTDGDGKADKFNVFARMDSPRGVIWEPRGKGGVLYVMAPPTLTAYYDEDGSGAAQRSEELVSGLGFDLKFRGADHTTNGCRLGIDGWIYIAVGDYGALQAKGKDGNSLHMKGGGVVRVRTDGSGLEFVSRGQRNIYDVAVSPTLDLFTRDNTNDGDGWNDRLSHVVLGANYGYPSLYQNFKGEFIDAMVDYGGGSPCGSIFLDEPAFGGEMGKGLFTVEWGRNAVYRHAVKADGASWKDDVKDFVKITRPTDMDVDGMGHAYISSWEGATFNYAGPTAGYVIRVTPKDLKPAPAPQLRRLSSLQLVETLKSTSGTWRQAAQRELLGRSKEPGVAEALIALAKNEAASLHSRVAAIFTLSQLDAAGSIPAFVALSQNAELREFALKALADDPRLAAQVPAIPFVAALDSANPRVRLQAVTGLGRLNKLESAGSMLALTADADPVVSHVAVHSLSAMKAADACLDALDSADAKVKPGALRALYAMHELKVVDGLIARLATVNDPALRQGILNALCRLDQRESPYELGKWWGTRPDTTGPLYKGERWEGSEKIEAALKAELARAGDEAGRWLVGNMYRTKVNFPGLIELMLAKAGSDTAAKLAAIDGMFSPKNELPAEATAAIQSVALNEKETPDLRGRALRLLQRGASNGAGFEAAVVVFAPLSGRDLGQPALTAAFEDFTRDAKNAKNIGALARLAEDKDAARRTLAQTILVNVATNNLIKGKEKETAEATLEKAWAKPEQAAGLLGVIARTKAKAFAAQVRTQLKAPDNAVAEAALFAYQALGLNSTDAPAPLISAMKYEDVLSAVLKGGDAAAGKDLFMRQGCIACHTVTAAEPAKGPMLAGIATRYTRKELTESILKPNAKISQGFESQWFDTKAGEHIEGFVTREGGDSLDVRNITGQAVKLEAGDIKARGKRDVSMMPEGLVNTIAPGELASLLAYLESLKGN